MIEIERNGLRAAPLALALSLLLAGCGSRAGGPAPLIVGTAEPPAAVEPMPMPMPAAPPAPARPPARIRVARGQSLSAIARDYHVPESALIAANHLQPPYRLLAGSALVIPRGGGAPPRVLLAELPPRPPVVEEAPRAAAPALPPPKPAKPAVAAGRTPPPARPQHGPAADVAADVAAEPAAGAATKSAPWRSPPAALADRAPLAGKPPAPAAGASPPGGRFQWPVRGHVLATYGTGPDGTHNDGINIAAPKGAPVEAADGGVVAYAGNELRGYGNLILIKHPNGWISAYAHCEQILVKRGEKVGRGQTIARVGATGSVGEPQLHFELRRGDHPVDPRSYLAPLPTAAAKGAEPGKLKS